MAEKRITEEFVKNSIITWLSQNDWQFLNIATPQGKGVDIRAKHNKYGRYYFIETKGSSNAEVDFVYSLGQIITRMKDSGSTRNYYALGLPQKSAAIALRRLPFQVSKKLLLHIFSVNEHGHVTRYLPKDIEKHQASTCKSQPQQKPRRYP